MIFRHSYSEASNPTCPVQIGLFGYFRIDEQDRGDAQNFFNNL